MTRTVNCRKYNEELPGLDLQVNAVHGPHPARVLLDDPVQGDR